MERNERDGAQIITECRDDASKWATAFCEVIDGIGRDKIDPDLMLGWFANAIETACDVRAERAAPKEAALREALEDADEIVCLYFAPWGAWKSARWEDICADGPFTAEHALKQIQKTLRDALSEGSAPAVSADARVEGGCHGLDTPTQVFFYEQDFYVLSNFSSFEIVWRGLRFATSEHAYHWEKFESVNADAALTIRRAASAHDAFKRAGEKKWLRRDDWDDVKIDIMREILRAKADQHEYVTRKLLATGERELIENSWRDDFWGWGPNKDGQNMLGKLWMEIRSERRAALKGKDQGHG